MKAAIYARYSSDQQRETSIEDQVRLCQEHAKAQGWTVVATFKDAAISGASAANRPDYTAMVERAEAGEFDIVLAEALDRLSRNLEHVAGLYNRLNFAEVKLVTLSEGEITPLHVGLTGTMNALYLTELAKKTKRGMRGRAEAGFNPGGRRYGYRHVPVYSATRKDAYGRRAVDAVQLEIEPQEAETVRRIFTDYANGKAPKRIALDLNADGIPSPTGKKWSGVALSGDNRGWGMLANEIYIGRRIWNKTQWRKNPTTGKRQMRLRPKSDWIVVEAPELRIIDQDLWDAVQARRQEQHAATAKLRATLHEKARTGAGPKYLLSGILRCAVCGGAYSIHDSYRYACGCNATRGETACSNKVRVPRKLAEQRLLAAIKDDLFSEEGIDEFKRQVRKILAERQRSKQSDRAQLKKDLTRVETELANLMLAVKQGIISPTLKDELQQAEAERQRLERALHLRTEVLDGIEEMLPRAVDHFADLVDNLETVSLRDISRARNSIKALVGGEIRLVPTEDGGLNAELQGDYRGLIDLAKQASGAKSKISVVAGEGLEPPTRGL